MKILTIPSRLALPEVLARHVVAQYGEAPQGLSRVLLLLPSRRAIRHLREAFLRVTQGRALLLPQMLALGDIEEKFVLRYARLSAEALAQLTQLPAAVDSLERLMTLSRLVQAYGKNMRFDQAVQLADQLAEMLDELHREQAEMAGFDTLVPAEFATQWQETLEFLQIIRHAWPQILAEQGRIEPWQRRNGLIALLAQSWKATAPDFPVIAAGTTGSVPAVADLLQVIAGLPQGELILPGLDLMLDEESYAQLEESHPQYGMKHLLDKFGVKRSEVLDLSHGEKSASAREQWLSLALQPAATTEHWQKNRLDAAAALENCHYLPCKDLRQESVTVALLLREALESPAQTAALVTADRSLARQVAAQLNRWGIAIDDSAGEPLHLTPVGNFILLLLECVDEGNAPVNLLSLLKHPLARLGYVPAEIRSLVRQLELGSLRGLKPHSLAEIQGGLQEEPAVLELLKRLETALEPLAQMAVEDKEYPAQAMLEACIKAAETMAGAAVLWQGDESREIAQLFSDLQTAVGDLALPFREFRGFVAQMLRREVFRSAWNNHPRLQILSPMEARMLQCDRVVLGGLNEGSWPARTEAEPWLNRPMRKALGLPAPERQIGLLAHDFTTLAAMPEVYLSRAEKSEGAATVPSRFIQRMEAVLSLAGAQWQPEHWQHWAERLDRPEHSLPPIAAPTPRPPVSARPRQLSVTAVERLIRDPYGIYAQKILRLKKLDPLQQLPEGREFGEAVHQALENFVRHGRLTAADLIAEGEKAFAPFGDAFVVEALWKPRFARIAEWVLGQEWPPQSLCEIEGKWVLATPRGAFTVTARVDRLDIAPEGISLIDYKTGAPPSKKEIELGLSNQLVLAAVMVQEGGFGADLAHRPVIGLSYWQLSGGRKGGEAHAVKPEKIEPMIEAAASKLPQLLARFDEEKTPYPSIPDWRSKPKYNDYEHLARIAEWANR